MQRVRFFISGKFPIAICFGNAAAAAKSLQLCPTLCDPVDCSLPGSSVHEILQVRMLEWVAVSFSSLMLQIKCLRSSVS